MHSRVSVSRAPPSCALLWIRGVLEPMGIKDLVSFPEEDAGPPMGSPLGLLARRPPPREDEEVLRPSLHVGQGVLAYAAVSLHAVSLHVGRGVLLAVFFFFFSYVGLIP